MINRRISIAPMMACTDRHFRQLMRLITSKTLLFTEMVTTPAILHGDQAYLLGYNPDEHPLALQLGGSDPRQLAQCAMIAQRYGYDEVNLNVGCPSDRVQNGAFGACLMKEPARVAQCVKAMREACDLPVTVKTRLGVDDQDSYAELCSFIETVAEAGCEVFGVHARKAWLQGLSPKENRDVPPLRYDVVYQLKRDYPELTIIINGGIKTFDEIDEHLRHVDGVMVGRAIYADPYWFAEVDQRYYGSGTAPASRTDVLKAYLPYVWQQVGQGVPMRALVKPLIGLFQGQPGARQWRRTLSERLLTKRASASDLEAVVLRLI